MALASLDGVRDDIVCPSCRSSVEKGAAWRCTNDRCDFARGFPVSGSTPVFIDFQKSIVTAQAFDGAAPPVWDAKHRMPLKRLFNAAMAAASKNRVAERNAGEIIRRLSTRSRRRILVIGGASVGNGAEALYRQQGIDIIAFDIVPSEFVQFVADAHTIPLADGSVDAVWIQAVLEHVLDPKSVVLEIARVLSEDGLVYADTPFLQQVHLGAYDFTRFTESGHRWLFGSFERIDSGVVLGPGAQFAWSLDYAARSVFRSSKAGRLLHLAALPLAYLIDRAASAEHAIDGACAVYFLGRKRGAPMHPHDIIAHYRGAQPVAAALQ